MDGFLLVRNDLGVGGWGPRNPFSERIEKPVWKIGPPLILPVLDLVKRETDTPRQQRTNGGGISLENLCSRQSAVLGLSVDVERSIEKYGFLETVSTCMSATFNYTIPRGRQIRGERVIIFRVLLGGGSLF